MVDLQAQSDVGSDLCGLTCVVLVAAGRRFATVVVGSMSFAGAVLLTSAFAAGSDCPEFLAGQQVGTVQSPDIVEPSGLAASQRNRGVLWTHNDSGDSARMFALDVQGTHLGTFQLAGIQAIDMEDMAVGPGPVAGESYVYLGDIGDNFGRTSIQVHRFPEPVVRLGQTPVDETLNQVETITLVYPDRPADAEALMVDLLTSDLYIVAKTRPPKVYVAPFPQSTTDQVTMQYVGALSGIEVTGGDFSLDGSEFIVRRRFRAALWQRPPGSDIEDVLAADPCPLPPIQGREGEAIAFDRLGRGYYALNEGLHEPIRYYERVVPEPSTWTLLFAAALVLAWRGAAGRVSRRPAEPMR